MRNRGLHRLRQRRRERRDHGGNRRHIRRWHDFRHNLRHADRRLLNRRRYHDLGWRNLGGNGRHHHGRRSFRGRWNRHHRRRGKGYFHHGSRGRRHRRSRLERRPDRWPWARRFDHPHSAGFHSRRSGNLRRGQGGRTSAAPLDHLFYGVTLLRFEAAELVFRRDSGLLTHVE